MDKPTTATEAEMLQAEAYQQMIPMAIEYGKWWAKTLQAVADKIKDE